MSITIPEAVKQFLSTITEPSQLVDRSGLVLGSFTPSRVLDKREPQISREEIQRRLQDRGGRPLEAILADLESRG